MVIDYFLGPNRRIDAVDRFGSHTVKTQLVQKCILVFIIILALIVGILVGKYWRHETPTQIKPLYWIDSMEPNVHYPGPGKSTMGMDLTPVYPNNAAADQSATDPSNVFISPTVINNLSIRTAPVVAGELMKQIETVGYADPKENKISSIYPPVEGWVKNLLVNAEGETVKIHQTLIQLSESQKSSHLIDIKSPQDGEIAALNIHPGMHVTPDTEMISLIDSSHIWMVAEVFADEAPYINAGESAEAKIAVFPDKIWPGVVEYIYPQVDPKTHSPKLKVRFDNSGGILKPNMYATISLFPETKPKMLIIPLEALIRTSTGTRVIVALGDGRFQVRAITTGVVSDDQVEVTSGLHKNEVVVVSGQFLIDSEANLKASLERLESPPQPGEK